MEENDAKELLNAAKALLDQHIEDFVYQIRDRSLDEVPADVSSWEAPSVKKWSAACETLRRIVTKYGA